MHCHGNFIFNRPVYGGAVSEVCLVFPEPFGSERLFLVGPHSRGLIAGVIQREKCMVRMGQVVLHGHCEREVAVTNSSEVQRHGRRISNDQ